LKSSPPGGCEGDEAYGGGEVSYGSNDGSINADADTDTNKVDNVSFM
jgi:hypothetical protein